MNPQELSRPGRSESGFTFVEIMLALAVGAIVIVGMYQAFNTLHKWWISAGIRTDMRQNARAGLETLTRDIEMAGYQSTPYGDLNKTGLAITLASAHEIEMDQQRPDTTTIGSANPVYEPRLVYYHLATDMRTGRQNLYRQIRTQPGLPAPDEIVAENVSAFTLGYFDKDNKKFKDPSDPANPAELQNPPYRPGTQYALVDTVPAQYSFGSPPPPALKNIRRIQVILTTIPARAVPFGPVPKPFTLMASVMPQNLGASDEVTADNTPPSVPTGLAVVDTGSCSEKLDVMWSPNTESDLAGYIISYGPTDYVDVPVRALVNRLVPRIRLNPRDLLITKYANRDTAPNTYPIQILAYDSSRNRSEKSGIIAGNPKVANNGNPSDYVGGAQDTTVNPLKPSAPTGFTVNARANEELSISWAPASSATAGYRLYRSTSAFPDGHIDGSLLIAGEATLHADVTTWTDTNLESCTTYHYAVASVNCDETLVAGYQHNDANAALSDYAVASGILQDTTPPPAPVLAGSQPDSPRIFLTLGNPLEAECPDFDRTEIFFSKTHLNGTVVSDSTHIPDSDVGIEGIFRNRGSQVIVFDSESEVVPPPPLESGATYHFLAVSYDRCGNPSPPAEWTSDATTTGLCAAIPLLAPLPDLTGGSYYSCQPGSVQLGWEYPQGVVGFAGFRITRYFLDGTKDRDLTSGPTWLTSWTDASPLKTGAEYFYEIKATDCLYEQDPILYSLNASLPYRIPPNSGVISPGQLQRFPASGEELDPENFVSTISDASTPYTYHNNVKFYLQNTSRSPMTIKKMAVSWDNPAVVLDSVAIGGAPSVTTVQTVSAGGAASGEAFPVNNTEIEDVASGVNSPSDSVPVLLRFTTPAGAVNRLVDMRNEALSISLWVAAHSDRDATCPTSNSIAIDVPRGPELGFFSQSAPGRDGIDSYAVIGPSGTARDTDIKVSTGVGVNVFGTVVDHSGELFLDGVNRGFDTLKIVGANAAAAGPTAVPTMPTSGTFDRALYSIGCDLSFGGDRYAISQSTPTACGSLMPADPSNANKVHWYYALAVDKTGNWDRVPNPDYGNYAFFQTTFDVCGSYSTPRQPSAPVWTGVTAPEDGSGITLTWMAPTTYNDPGHTPIVSDDVLTYDVYYSNDSGLSWFPALGGANLSSLRYDHVALSLGDPHLPAGTYRYMVKAKNSCVSCAGTACALPPSCVQGGCCSDCSSESSDGVVIP